MRVSREQAAANRERIVEAAARLFRDHGYEGVGVDAIMKEAGLTHGGFYGHFASKEQLAGEALALTCAQARSKNETGDLAAALEHYLNEAHCADRAGGCPVAALGAEMPRWDANARATMTGHLRSWFERMGGLLAKAGGGETARRQRAIATVAGMVGALTLARAVDDDALRREILAAARAAFGPGEAAESTH